MARKSDRLPISQSRKFILSDDTQFAIKEAYKAARTNLVFSLAEDERKVVVITSCSPSEGKSTNCLNMAITTAETGAEVLLIDADMRKPVQHSLLRLDNKTGLSSVLGGIVRDVSKVINRNVRSHLDILTSGPIPPNPAELLQGSKMEQLLELVGDHYDYVFIDTPPINVVTDALLLNNRTAGIIFVVKEGHTRHEEIRESLEKTRMTNGRVLGFIKVNCAAKGSGGGYKYNYKYKYKYKNYNYKYQEQ
ncbi:MAG: CpsD/CapB family tyrosine-protein kinase [Ruminiclostridium sp.]|nr:CpsD/CapB family tyrosine-protein kinase [Ruminiclostridium sp.]